MQLHAYGRLNEAGKCSDARQTTGIVYERLIKRSSGMCCDVHRRLGPSNVDAATVFPSQPGRLVKLTETVGKGMK